MPIFNKRVGILLIISSLVSISSKADVGITSQLRGHYFKLSETLGISHTIASDSSQKTVLKDPSRAVTKSLLSTVIPTAAGIGFLKMDKSHDESFLNLMGGILMAYGIIVGPSTGHAYAESLNQGSVVLRFAGTFIFGLSGLIGAQAVVSCSAAPQKCDGFQTFEYVMWISGIITIGSAIYSIITADNAVREYNREMRKKNKVSLVPFTDTQTGAKGLTFRIRL